MKKDELLDGINKMKEENDAAEENNVADAVIKKEPAKVDNKNELAIPEGYTYEYEKAQDEPARIFQQARMEAFPNPIHRRLADVSGATDWNTIKTKDQYMQHLKSRLGGAGQRDENRRKSDEMITDAHIKEYIDKYNDELKLKDWGSKVNNNDEDAIWDKFENNEIDEKRRNELLNERSKNIAESDSFEKAKSIDELDKMGFEGNHNIIINKLRNSVYDTPSEAMKDLEKYNPSDREKAYVKAYANKVFAVDSTANNGLAGDFNKAGYEVDVLNNKTLVATSPTGQKYTVKQNEDLGFDVYKGVDKIISDVNVNRESITDKINEYEKQGKNEDENNFDDPLTIDLNKFASDQPNYGKVMRSVNDKLTPEQSIAYNKAIRAITGSEGRGLSTQLSQDDEYLTPEERQLKDNIIKAASPIGSYTKVFRTDDENWLNGISIGETVPMNLFMNGTLDPDYVIPENQGKVQQKIVFNLSPNDNVIVPNLEKEKEIDIVNKTGKTKLQVTHILRDKDGTPIYFVRLY